MARMWDARNPEDPDGEDIRQKLYYADFKTPRENECVGGQGNDHAILNVKPSDLQLFHSVIY